MKAEFEMPILRAAIEAVMPACSTDKDRPHLGSICIDTMGPAPRAIATDGHWLAEYTFEAKSIEEPGRVAVSLERATKLLAMLSDELAAALMVTDDSLCRFDLEKVGRIDCIPAGSFPQTDTIWPTGDGQRLSRVAMAPKLLTRIGKAFGCTKGDGLHFIFFGDNAPILITSATRVEMRALLMPVRQLEMGFP